MARGINKVIILGHLTRDVELKYIPNGNPVANINIATNESWKDKQTGQTVDKVEYHRVVIFGKLAEIAGQYLKKGSLIYIEGMLQTRKWADQSGQDRYTTEIVVNMQGTMQMLDKKGDNAQGDYQQNQAQPQQQPPTNDDFKDMGQPNFDSIEDDIPF